MLFIYNKLHIHTLAITMDLWQQRRSLPIVHKASYKENGFWKSLHINRMSGKTLIKWFILNIEGKLIIEFLTVETECFIQECWIPWRYDCILYIK